MKIYLFEQKRWAFYILSCVIYNYARIGCSECLLARLAFTLHCLYTNEITKGTDNEKALHNFTNHLLSNSTHISSFRHYSHHI